MANGILGSVDLSATTYTGVYLVPENTFSVVTVNIVNKNNMIKRLKIRKSLNRYDKFKTSFYQKVQKGFITLASKNKKRYKIINSNYSIEHNKEIILRTMDKIL